MGRRCLAALMFALLAGSVAGSYAGPSSPLNVELLMPQIPFPGQEADIDCLLESPLDLSDVRLTIKLSEGILLTNGSLTWSGNLSAHVPRVFSLTVRIASPSNKTISATAYSRVSETDAYSDTSSIYFHSSPEMRALGHILDTVRTETEAVSRKTGEITRPTKLDQQYKVQARPERVIDSYVPGQPEPVMGRDFKSLPIDATAGTLTVTGRWCYYDRNDVYTPMSWVLVELIRGSDGANLDYAYIHEDGYYTFDPVTNPGSAGFRVKVWCHYDNPTIACDDKPLRVVWEGDGRDDDGLGIIGFAAQTPIHTSADGTYDIGTYHINNGSANEPAWWGMMDLTRAFWWCNQWSGGTKNAGGVTVEWSPTSTHGNHNHRDDDGGNIHLKSDALDVSSVILHEYGHEVQWDGYGQWLPEADCPSPHYGERISGPHCAWYEGFADWYSLAVNNDPVYHWPGGGQLDFEAPTWGSAGWDDGDQVEGRVAGSLWDIHDGPNDGYDSCDLGIDDIWNTWYGSGNLDNTFPDFWNRWKAAGRPQHRPVLAMYQNTIDYNTAPTLNMLPDQTTAEDTPKLNAFNVRDYASDPESSDSELLYTLEFVQHPELGVSIDPNGYIDIDPALDWNGLGGVSVRCSDGISTASRSFIVTVTPVNDSPLIFGLPDKTLNEDDPADNAINLWLYSSDVDNIDSELTFSIVMNTFPQCGVSIDSNHYVDINPQANWYGTSTVTIRVTDPGGKASEDTFIITVKGVNDPPVLTGIPNRSLDEDTSLDNTIDLWAYASDVETSDANLTFSIGTVTDPRCGVSIDSDRYIDINPEPDWDGTSDVTVRVRDTGGLYAEDTFQVKVIGSNDPPVISGLPDLLCAKDGFLNDYIDLRQFTADPESTDEELTFTITANTDPYCGVTIDTLDHVDVKPKANWTGYSDVTIRATDPGGLWSEDTFRVVVANLYPTIAQARANADGTWVGVIQRWVSATFADRFYVQDPYRASGICVNYAGGPSPNTQVRVAGPLSNSYAERRITPYLLQEMGPSAPAEPLGITNGAMGGSAPDAYTTAVPQSGSGLYNVGLLVRTTGKVMYHPGGSSFYIWDGSSVVDSRPATGDPWLRVEALPSGWRPPVGSWVTITGISGAETLGGKPMRVLRPRSDEDVVINAMRAAYVYRTNYPEAVAFKNLLDANSLPTRLIGVNELPSINWSSYHVVLIGSDTLPWDDLANVDRVLSANLPIIAIGGGGVTFLEAVTTPDLYLGTTNSLHLLNQTAVIVTGGDIYSYPYSLPSAPGTAIQVIKAPGIDLASLNDPTGVTLQMLKDQSANTYYALAGEGGRFYQWGFYGQPDKMTEQGKHLFINLIYRTARP